MSEKQGIMLEILSLTRRVWSILTMIPIFTLTGHSDEIFCYTSFDEYWLVTGSWDCDVILWDLKNGFASINFPDHIEAVSCLKMNSLHIVTGSLDGNVRIWSWKIGILEHTLEASKEIYCLEITKTRIIAAGSDSQVHIWKWNGDIVFTLSGHLGIVRHIKCLDDDILISAGDMRRIMIWDLINDHCGITLHRNPCQIGKILMNDFCVIVAPDSSNSQFYVLSFL